MHRHSIDPLSGYCQITVLMPFGATSLRMPCYRSVLSPNNITLSAVCVDTAQHGRLIPLYFVEMQIDSSCKETPLEKITQRGKKIKDYFWQLPPPTHPLQKTPGTISYSGEIWLLIVLSTDLRFSVGFNIYVLWEWAVLMAFRKAIDGLHRQVNNDTACGNGNGKSGI